MSDHPACGLYRTTQALGEIPAGRLVYFHNHGNPGAGIYLPRAWALNRVQWHERGNTVPGPEWSSTMQPLAAEGLYRVSSKFTCCERNCVTFQPEQLVQLGYDGDGKAILFIPEWSARGLGFPERGTVIDAEKTRLLSKLAVPESNTAPAGGLLH
jgi:hypothetical protein